MSGRVGRCRAWRLTAAVTVAVVVAAACGGPDPEEELADAVRATADTPVTFELGARADGDALASLSDGAAGAAFLDQAGVRGARDPDGALQLAVTIAGDTPFLEVIVPCVRCGDGASSSVLLRTGFAELLPVGDQDPAEQLDPILTELGVDEAGRRALAASFAGGWVEVTGLEGLGDLVDAASGSSTDASTDATDAPADPVTVEELLGAVTVVTARDAGDVRRLEVEVALGELLDLAGFDGRDAARAVPGTVVLRDGLLQEVRLELTDLGADPADDGGRRRCRGRAGRSPWSSPWHRPTGRRPSTGPTPRSP